MLQSERFRKILSFLSLFLLILSFGANIALGTTETRWDTSNQNDSKNYPVSNTTTTGLGISGTIAQLAASDNSYMVIDNGTGSTNTVGEVNIIFNGTFSSGSIPFLQIALELKTNTSVTYYFQGYNFTQNGWDTSPSTMYDTSLTPTSDTTKYRYSVYDGLKYVDSLGNWMFRIVCNGTSRFRLSLDLLWFRSVSYQSTTTNTNSALGSIQFVDGLQVGIRVWYEGSTYSETELTSGISATVTGSTGTSAAVNGTWNCPATSNVRRVVIRYYIGGSLATTISNDLGAGGLPILFETADLNTTATLVTLTAVTWSVHYHFRYIAADDVDYFYFGSNTYNSCIANFQYTTPAPGTELDIYSSISLTLTPTVSHSISFSRSTILTESFTVTSQKSVGWNVYSPIQLGFTLQSLFSFTRELNIFSDITIDLMPTVSRSISFSQFIVFAENFNVDSQKTVTWNLYSPIQINFNPQGSFSFKRELNIFGSITISWNLDDSKTVGIDIAGTIPLLPQIMSTFGPTSTSVIIPPTRPPQFVPPSITPTPGPSGPSGEKPQIPFQFLVVIIVVVAAILGIASQEQDRGKKRLKALRKKMEEKSPFD